MSYQSNRQHSKNYRKRNNANHPAFNNSINNSKSNTDPNLQNHTNRNYMFNHNHRIHNNMRPTRHNQTPMRMPMNPMVNRRPPHSLSTSPAPPLLPLPPIPRPVYNMGLQPQTSNNNSLLMPFQNEPAHPPPNSSYMFPHPSYPAQRNQQYLLPDHQQLVHPQPKHQYPEYQYPNHLHGEYDHPEHRYEEYPRMDHGLQEYKYPDHQYTEYPSPDYCLQQYPNPEHLPSSEGIPDVPDRATDSDNQGVVDMDLCSLTEEDSGDNDSVVTLKPQTNSTNQILNNFDEKTVTGRFDEQVKNLQVDTGIDDDTDMKTDCFFDCDDDDEDEDLEAPYSPSNLFKPLKPMPEVDKILRSPERAEMKKRVFEWINKSGEDDERNQYKLRCMEEKHSASLSGQATTPIPQTRQEAQDVRPLEPPPRPVEIPLRPLPDIIYLEDPRLKVIERRFRGKLRAIVLRLWVQRFRNVYSEEEIEIELKRVVILQGQPLQWSRMILIYERPSVNLHLITKVVTLTSILVNVLEVHGWVGPVKIPLERSKPYNLNDPRLNKSQLKRKLPKYINRLPTRLLKETVRNSKERKQEKRNHNSMRRTLNKTNSSEISLLKDCNKPSNET